MDFKEQYKDPRWQKKRLETLEKASYTCEVCYSKEKTLHVHHGNYLKGEYLWSEKYQLYVLCEDCHKFAHKQMEEIKKSIGKIHPHNYFSLSKLLYKLSFNGKTATK